ncbi:ThiF family adenylyltransferase [Pannonibacter sp. Q-1]
MSSEGQSWALDQLNEIARVSNGALEVCSVEEPAAEGGVLTLTVSVDCRAFARAEGGIPLKARERLRITVPSHFPLSKPDAYFIHKRYADFAHVQWGDSICLYQAPEVEWVPSQGMFGFIERIDDWLRAGAANELDPVGMPLHPPVAYTTGNYSIVPTVNTPTPSHSFWGGFVQVTRDSEVSAELGDWFAYGDDRPEGRIASAILLSTTMPHEYPATMIDLIKALVARGLPLDIIHTIVNLGALSTPEGKPSFFILGAAMRGIVGGEMRQHLACWKIDPDQSQLLRDAVMATTPDEPKDVEAFYSWAASAKVEWCPILEDRPEIVERRDSQSSSAFWKGKRIAVLGCGAIGSAVAAILVRAGVDRLELYDNKVVTPGVLVRQGFDRRQIGYTKCSALRVQLIGIRSDIEITAHHRNVLNVLRSQDEFDQLFGVDIVIDATASRSVSTALELHFRHTPKEHSPIITMVLGHNADYGLLTLVKKSHVGMSLDVDRRTKLSLGDSGNGHAYLEEFWPTQASRRQPFQPEPGCSSPTFRGSYADVLSVTSRMTNVAAVWLSKDAVAPRAFALNLSGENLNAQVREIELEWSPYLIVPDRRHGFQIRLRKEAFATLLSWVRRSERVRGRKVETGGVLFGEIDDLLKVIWIDEVSGPPPDSVASPEGFVCGTAGVAEMNDEKVARTTGSVSFMGMWHTHPEGIPVPSTTDLGAMKELLGQDSTFLGRNFLMMIVGGSSKLPLVSSTVFQRSDYAK